MEDKQDTKNAQRYLLLALFAFMLLLVSFLLLQNLYQDTMFNFNTPGEHPLNQWPRYR